MRTTILQGSKNPYEPFRLNSPIICYNIDTAYHFYDSLDHTWCEVPINEPNLLLSSRFHSRRIMTLHSRENHLLKLTTAYVLLLNDYPDMKISPVLERSKKMCHAGVLFCQIRLPNRKCIQLNDSKTLLGNIDIISFIDSFGDSTLETLAERFSSSWIKFQEFFYHQTKLNLKATIASSGMKLFEKWLPRGRLQRLGDSLEKQFRINCDYKAIHYSQDYCGDYWQYDLNAAYPFAYESGLPHGPAEHIDIHTNKWQEEYVCYYVYGTHNGTSQYIKIDGDKDSWYSKEYYEYLLDRGIRFCVKRALGWKWMLYPQDWLSWIDTNREQYTSSSSEYQLQKMLCNTPHGKMLSPYEQTATRFQENPPDDTWTNDHLYFINQLSAYAEEHSQEEFDLALELGKYLWRKDIIARKCYHQFHCGALVVQRNNVYMLQILDWLIAHDVKIISVNTDSVCVDRPIDHLIPMHSSRRGWFKLVEKSTGRFHQSYRISQGKSNLPGLPESVRSPSVIEQLMETGQAKMTGKLNITEWTNPGKTMSAEWNIHI